MSPAYKKLICSFALILSGITSLNGQQLPEGFAYGGLCVNHSLHGFTPMDVYMNDINRKYQPSDSYNYMTNAPGFILGINEERLGIEFSRASAVSQAKYAFIATDNNTYEVDEKLRVVNSQLKLYYMLPIPKINRFYVGASMDFGILRNNRKQTGEGFTGKWEKFYTSTGLLKSYKSTDMLAGLGLRVGFVISHINIMASTQFLFMDANFDGYAGNKLKMNSQHIQLSVSYAFYE